MSPQPPQFDKDDWSGGCIEGTLRYRAMTSAERGRALSAAWDHPTSKGWFAKRDLQTPVASGEVELNEGDIRWSYGWTTFEGGVAVPTAHCLLGHCLGGSDDGFEIVCFGFPVGGLGRCFEVGAYPLEPAGAWWDSVASFLVSAAERMHRCVPATRGVVGWECDGAEDFLYQMGPVPPHRWGVYLTAEGERLRRYPPTEDGALVGIQP